MSYTPHRLIAGALIAVALITIGLGFFVGGGPAQARREGRDNARTQGLSQINNAITYAYSTQKKLPTPQEYRDLYRTSAIGLTGSHPLAKEPPTYRALTATSYELCTSFETTQQPNLAPYAAKTAPLLVTPSESPDFWNHAAGTVCYSIAIPAYAIEQVKQAPPTVSSTTP